MKTAACLAVVGLLLSSAAGAPPQGDGSASSSLMARAVADERGGDPFADAAPASLFAIQPPKPREFQVHDLVQIVVRETSTARSSQELETEKEYELDGKIPNWPAFTLEDLLQLQIEAGSTVTDPRLQLEFNKDFTGEGEYERKDDLTARLTAEVIEILPNGNLVLEARTSIRNDDEVLSMKVTGTCRQEDVTPANTVMSGQLHDLAIEKVHDGELKKAGEKGIIAKVLDAIFAF
jgi:flagellar L-ring protein precursor FlgH